MALFFPLMALAWLWVQRGEKGEENGEIKEVELLIDLFIKG
jgi:hypothetical protein